MCYTMKKTDTTTLNGWKKPTSKMNYQIYNMEKNMQSLGQSSMIYKIKFTFIKRTKKNEN